MWQASYAPVLRTTELRAYGALGIGANGTKCKPLVDIMVFLGQPLSQEGASAQDFIGLQF